MIPSLKWLFHLYFSKRSSSEFGFHKNNFFYIDSLTPVLAKEFKIYNSTSLIVIRKNSPMRHPPNPATRWAPNASMLGALMSSCITAFLPHFPLHTLGFVPKYLPTPHLTTFLSLYLMLFLLALMPPSSILIWRNFRATTQMSSSLVDTGISSSDPSKYPVPFLMPALCYGHCLSLFLSFFLSSLLPFLQQILYWVATTHQTPVFTAHWPTSTLKFSSALFNDHPFPKVHPLGLPDLAHWNRGCLVTFEV